MAELTKEEHIKIHKELHQSLDKLVADWIMQTGALPSKCNVMSLMKWAHEQTINPSARNNCIPQPTELKPNDVVQVNPDSQLDEKDGFFAGCFIIVEEVKQWGVKGYALSPNERGKPASQILGRFKHEDISYVGHAEWTIKA